MFLFNKKEMKYSEKAGSVRSKRCISSLGITRTVVGAIAVAVAVLRAWPAKHQIPQKFPASRIVTTTVLPRTDVTDNLTIPFSINRTFAAGSPLANRISFFLKSTNLLTPAEKLRNDWTSNVSALLWAVDSRIPLSIVGLRSREIIAGAAMALPCASLPELGI